MWTDTVLEQRFEFPRNRGRVACRSRDDGLRSAGEHLALDHALAHEAPALRFARYPLAAALGAHEDAALAVRGDYCGEQQIDVIRRPSGGGALYLDQTQLTWTLALPASGREPGVLARLLRRHGEAVVAALDELGVPAVFQFPNDIEVDGRKIAVGFVGEENGHWLVQGSLLITEPDTENMLKILRVPTEKLSAQGVLSARQRLLCLEECLDGPADWEWVRVTLAEALAEAFGLYLMDEPPAARVSQAGDAAEVSVSRATVAVDLPATQIPTGKVMKAFRKTPGGTLYLSIKLGPGGRIRQAAFSGTVQVSPGSFFNDIASALRGVPRGHAVLALDVVLENLADADLLGFTLADVRGLLGQVLSRRELSQSLGIRAAQANALIIHDPTGAVPAEDILARATVMLVPYCAKLAECKFRHRDGCSECGMCEVGDAYRLARERGMRVVTITRFEHLQATLADMVRDEVPAYVGMCCESFYLKRHYAFAEAGIPAVFTDITGANCYELRQEDLAYAGQFKAEARLQVELVEKVMRFVPPVRTSVTQESGSGR